MPDILEQLHPDVRSYLHGGYLLDYDLKNLMHAWDASIREASVFYAARALEALSAAALDAVGLKGKESVFSNLTRLAEYGLTPRHTLYWAHALRRTGNAVRHACSRTSAEEEETTVAFLEYWLRWFFCVFPYGACLPDLTVGGAEAPFIRDASLRRMLDMIESNRLDPQAAARDVLEGRYEKIRRAPAVLAVLAERFLDANLLEEARQFLDWAAAEHPQDLRLVQLRGLCYSRAGRLDEGIDILEPWYKRYRTDDEMIGIMAGIYKRKWRASPEDSQWLARSHKAYESGWKQDRDNTYLGINAATTALFLGQTEKAESIASKVREVLTDRCRVLERLAKDGRADLNLWDRLTLVEAELLGSNFDAAADAFQQAGRDHPNATGSLAVARQQFAEIAERLGAPKGMFTEQHSR